MGYFSKGICSPSSRASVKMQTQNSIVHFPLKHSTNKSKTWSIFLRQLSEKYKLPDPLECLKNDAPEKSIYKEMILTKITAYYESELRKNSVSNSSMKYLNIVAWG